MPRTAQIHLYRPSDAFGQLICWRLESAFSHATIQIDDVIYSATFPKIVAVSPDDKAFGMTPLGPRLGESYTLINLTDDQITRMEAWCQSMLGSDYDVLAMVAWAFRWQWAQRPNHCYCFEFVYDALSACGVFPASKGLITGDQLLAAALLKNVVRIPTAGKLFSKQNAVMARAGRQPISEKLKAAVL